MTVRTGPGWARIEVSDTGTEEWHAPEGTDLGAEYGRGLAIVAALADKLGYDITADGRRSGRKLAGQTYLIHRASPRARHLVR